MAEVHGIEIIYLNNIEESCKYIISNNISIAILEQAIIERYSDDNTSLLNIIENISNSFDNIIKI